MERTRYLKHSIKTIRFSSNHTIEFIFRSGRKYENWDRDSLKEKKFDTLLLMTFGMKRAGRRRLPTPMMKRDFVNKESLKHRTTITSIRSRNLFLSFSVHNSRMRHGRCYNPWNIIYIENFNKKSHQLPNLDNIFYDFDMSYK